MRSIVSALCGILCAFPAAGQNIPVDFVDKPDRPLVIENPGAGKALFCFFSEDFDKDRNYSCKAYECDSRSLQVLRVGSPASLSVRGESGARVRLLCHTFRGADYFFAVENANVCQLYRVAGNDLSLTMVDSITLKPGERMVQGISDGEQAHILCTWRKKKKKALTVYSIGPEGRLHAHPIALPAKQDNSIDGMFKGDFAPWPVKSGMELDPSRAAAPVKMFAAPDKIRITFDDAVVGSDNTGTIAAILKIAVIDLAVDSLHLARHYYADRLIFNPVQEGRSSYISDDRLFQLYFNADVFVLRIRDLESGQSLFKETLLREDTACNFAGSPLLMPGSGLFKEEKDPRAIRDFLRRFHKFKPFLQVRRDGDNWLMCTGGYDISLAFSGGVPASGLAGTPAFGPVSERSFAFYSAVSAQSLVRAPAYYEKPLLAVYAETLKTLKPRNPALYRVGGRFYLGFYDDEAGQYRFRPLPVEAR